MNNLEIVIKYVCPQTKEMIYLKKKWLIAILSVIILLSFTACGTQNQASTKQPPKNSKAQIIHKNANHQQPQTSTTSPSPTPITEENSLTVSKMEYENIHVGMTYEQVRNIIGSDGNIISESNNKITYSWDGEGTADSKAEFIFSSNKLKSKTEIGLQ